MKSFKLLSLISLLSMGGTTLGWSNPFNVKLWVPGSSHTNPLKEAQYVAALAAKDSGTITNLMYNDAIIKTSAATLVLASAAAYLFHKTRKETTTWKRFLGFGLCGITILAGAYTGLQACLLPALKSLNTYTLGQAFRQS